MRVTLLSIVAGLVSTGCQSDTDVRRIHLPPEAAILVPEAEQVFRQGVGPLAFSGTTFDTFDTFDTLAATWILDGEEQSAPIASDSTVTLDLDAETLALGEHLLSLHVLDSDDMADQFDVPWVLLGAISAPEVTITAPADASAFAPGDEITFRGVAVDNNTAPGDLQFVWTSSQDGELAGAISGDGQSVLFRNDLSPGTHVVALTVTDVDGEVGEDTITIAIGGEIEPDPDPDPVEAEVGDLVFSELMVNPNEVEDEIGEWVELYNTSTSTIDLDGYSFHDLDTDAYTLGSVLVAGHDYVVLCADLDASQNGGIDCDGYFARKSTDILVGMALGNDGDEVVLSRPDGVVIDQVLYDGTWFTPGVATGLDPSRLDADNNDDETMWCNASTTVPGALEPGTPGLVNDPC